MTPPLLKDLPPRPKSRLDAYWDRNWKWIVPSLCAVATLMIFALVALLAAFMKQSGAYQGALQRARSSPEVAAAIGTPIKEGFLVAGNIQVSGPSGRADLAIPIAGPKGEGMIYLDASKMLGQWHFDRLIVQVTRDGQRIDLSDGRPKPYHPPDDKPEPDPPIAR